MRKPRKDVIAVAFLCLVITLFFAQELFTDRTLVTFRLTNVFPWLSDATQEELDQASVTSDCTFSYFPRRVFATRMIRQGQIPYWNPHQFGGTPFLANFQSAVFYPVNLMLYGFDPATQMDLFLYLHFLVAAIFTYLFARKLGLTRRASVVSALSFTFCGFMVTRYGQPTFVSTASWLPALLYFAERLMEAPGFRRSGVLALVLSLCILAGFPQLVLLNVYTLVLYLAIRLALLKEKRGRWKCMTAVFLVLSLVVAGLVCAFQLLPTYELSTFSYRKVLPFDMVLSSAHHGLVGLKYLIPDILGDPVEIGVLSKALHKVEGEPAFIQNYVGTTGYVGIIPLLLAVLALTKPRRRLVPFVVLAALTLLTVFGTGLLSVFYRFLPGFNFSRIDRVILIYMCSISMLAGYGFDIALHGHARKRLFYTGAVFIAFAASFAIWISSTGIDLILRHVGDIVSRDAYLAYAPRKIWGFTIIAVLSGVLLLLRSRNRVSRNLFFVAVGAVLLVDLLSNGLTFKVSQPADGVLPASSYIEDLKADKGLWRIAKYGANVIPANTATLLGIDDIHGYDALNVNHYMEVLGVIDSSMIAVGNAALRRRIGPVTDRGALDSKIMDLLNVKYILSVGETEGRKRRPVTLLNDDYLPRAFIVDRARFFDTHAEILEYMKTGEFEPAEEVLLKPRRKGREPDQDPDSLVTGTPGTAEITDHGPNGVTIAVEVERISYLVVSDVYYPGWRVYVDGNERALFRADCAFRAVRIRPGDRVVRMEFRPQYFRIGLLFSAAGIALLAVLISSRRRTPVTPEKQEHHDPT
ncbi:MAG: YfhO family protein [Candidatus Eisenbacteria bacterium]